MSILVRIACLIIGCLAFFAATSAWGEDWPQFRGPTGQGISQETGLPVHWSATENVAWKVEIPGEGWSSPIVFQDRVFVTSTLEEGVSCHLTCLDRKSGKTLWNREVVRQEPTRKETKNSHATPTPVTDGQRVYVAFSGGALAAVAFDGSVEWTNLASKFYSKHGLGASPILVDDLLVMPFDGSSPGEDKEVGWKKPWDQAFLVALDRQTGNVRWKATRGLSRIAHVTPNLLHENGRTQIVSGAGDVIQGFDPANGERIWTVFSQGEGVTPSIVIGDGLIFTCSGFEKPTIRTVRTGGKGDVTKSHIAWEQTRGVPSLASLLYVKPYLYAITDKGVATCLKAATGDVVWEERIGGNHSASPVYGDGKIYFLSEQGETAIIAAGPEFKLLARNSIDEKCQASIAISHQQLFIRSDHNLFSIGR